MYAIEIFDQIYVSVRGTKITDVRNVVNDVANIFRNPQIGRRETTCDHELYVQKIFAKVTNGDGLKRKYDKNDLKAHAFNAPGFSKTVDCKYKYSDKYQVTKQMKIQLVIWVNHVVK